MLIYIRIYIYIHILGDAGEGRKTALQLCKVALTALRGSPPNSCESRPLSQLLISLHLAASSLPEFANGYRQLVQTTIGEGKKKTSCLSAFSFLALNARSFFCETACPPPFCFVLFCRCILHTRRIDNCLTTCRSQLLVYALLVYETLTH